MCASSYSSSTQIAKNIFRFVFFFFSAEHIFFRCMHSLAQHKSPRSTKWKFSRLRCAIVFRSRSHCAAIFIQFKFFFFARLRLPITTSAFLLLLIRSLACCVVVVSHVTQQSAAINIRIHWETFSSLRERWVWLGTWLELISFAWASCRLLARRDTAMM